jgi:hypothetical protein
VNIKRRHEDADSLARTAGFLLCTNLNHTSVGWGNKHPGARRNRPFRVAEEIQNKQREDQKEGGGKKEKPARPEKPKTQQPPSDQNQRQAIPVPVFHHNRWVRYAAPDKRRPAGASDPPQLSKHPPFPQTSASLAREGFKPLAWAPG